MSSKVFGPYITLETAKDLGVLQEIKDEGLEVDSPDMPLKVKRPVDNPVVFEDKKGLMHKMFGLTEGSMAGPDTDRPAPKKVVKEMRVRKAAGKGYIAEHHHVSVHHPMEEHVIAGGPKELAQHMLEHMGEGQMDAGEQEPEAPSNPMQTAME